MRRPACGRPASYRTSKKSVPNFGTLFANSRIGLGSRRFYRRACGSAHFANLTPHDTPHRTVLTEIGDGLGDHFLDGDRLVPDVVLFVEAILLVELLHIPGDDLLHHLLGFS